MSPLLFLLLLSVGSAEDENEVTRVIITYNNAWVNEYQMSVSLWDAGYISSFRINTLYNVRAKLKARCLNIGKNCDLLDAYEITSDDTIQELQSNKNKEDLPDRAILLCNLIMTLSGGSDSDSRSHIHCPMNIKGFGDFSLILDAMAQLGVDITNRSVLLNFYNTYIPNLFSPTMDKNIVLNDLSNREFFPLFWRMNAVMNYLGYGLASRFSNLERDEGVVYIPTAGKGLLDMREQMELLKILATASCVRVEIGHRTFITTKKSGPSIKLGQVVDYLRRMLEDSPVENFVISNGGFADKNILFLWSKGNSSILLRTITVKNMVDCIDSSTDTVKSIKILASDITDPLFKYLKGRRNLGSDIKIQLVPAVDPVNMSYSALGDQNAFLKQKVGYVLIFFSSTCCIPEGGCVDITVRDNKLLASLSASFWDECKLLAEEGNLRVFQFCGLSRSIVSLGDELGCYGLEYKNIPGTLYHFKDFISRFPDDVKVVRSVDSEAEAFIHTLSISYSTGRVVGLDIKTSMPERMSS